MAGHVALPWIHRVFSLMKRCGLGTYHGLRDKHLHAYFNEVVFRYNIPFYRHVSFATTLGLAAPPPPAPPRAICCALPLPIPRTGRHATKITVSPLTSV